MPGLGGKGVALGVCAALSGVLFIAGIALTFSLPSIFNTMVRSGIPVDSVNHVNYPVFSDHGGQVPITMSFSFWNLTNPTDFQNGAKPKLVLVGPYVYREFLWRENISFSPDRTSVSFTYHNPFVFVPERSGARQETDNITTVNIVFAGAIATIDSIGNKFQRELFVNAVNLTTAPNDDDPLNPQPATYMYQTRTVAELLFGYQDALLTVLAGAAAMNNRTLPDTVALSSRDQPLFFSAPSSMLTGVSDPAQTQVFTSWAGQKALNLWGTPWANMINGTDAWQFRPGVSCSDTLEVFVDALFRSVPFVCDPASKWPRSYAGLDVHPFGIDDSVFSPDKAFYNYGPKGVANLSIAVPGPVFVSRPYFLGADPYYRSLLDSFPEPSPDKDTVVYVEPVTGSSLAARKFIQVNVLVKPYKDILMASRLNTSYFPVLMLDELTLSPKGLTDLLKSQVFTPMSTAHSVCYAMIGLGAALVVICIGVLVYLKRKHDEYDGSVNRPLIQPGMRGL